MILTASTQALATTRTRNTRNTSLSGATRYIREPTPARECEETLQIAMRLEFPPEEGSIEEYRSQPGAVCEEGRTQGEG